MQGLLTKTLLILFTLFLWYPLVACADDEEWKEDQYWAHQREVRKKAQEQEEKHKRAWEREHEAWKKTEGWYARQKAEEGAREREKKEQEGNPEIRQKARAADQWWRDSPLQ